MQKETKEIPSGTINNRMHFALLEENSEPKKYVIGFEIIQWNDLRKIYVGEVDPFDGRIVGIKEKIDGFDGTDVKPDIKLVRKEIWEEMYGRQRR